MGIPLFFAADRHCIAETKDFDVRMRTIETATDAELSTGRSVRLDLPNLGNLPVEVLCADMARDARAVVVALRKGSAQAPA